MNFSGKKYDDYLRCKKLLRCSINSINILIKSELKSHYSDSRILQENKIQSGLT